MLKIKKKLKIKIKKHFKIKMSQFIAQMSHAGAVTECAAALLSFRYPTSFTGKRRANHHH